MLAPPRTAAVDTLLNFVIAGEVRSGAAVVSTALGHAKGACCHLDLFHDSEEIRRESYEGYFGVCQDPVKAPEWFHAVKTDSNTNPYQYLRDVVFDHPRWGEQAVGVRLAFPTIARYELFDTFEERIREGDFCVVTVLRNPVACFVSLKQAQQSGVWRAGINSNREDCCPSSIRLDPQELTQFVRHHAAVLGKIRASCGPRVGPDAYFEVQYRDLYLDFNRQMENLLEFLELPQQKIPTPTIRRLRNYSFERRVTNLVETKYEVPSDVKALLEDPEIF